MIKLSFNFFPAIFTIILFIVSYIIHSLYVSVISPTVTDTAEITNAITFHMSVAAAVLFLVSYVAALVLDYEGLHLYAAAAQNLYMILFPGLTLITFGTVRSLAKGHNASCLGSILYIAIYAMLFFFTSVTLVLASFAGAILVIASAMKARNKNKHDK